MSRHQPDRLIREVPRRQTQAQRPSLEQLLRRRGNQDRGIARAYRDYGYRLQEIADWLGAHYATVSRCLKRVEQNL